MAIPVAAYLVSTVPVTATETHQWRQKSDTVRTLVLGVQAARQSHPGKAIALQGISAGLFDLSFADQAFHRRLGMPMTYISLTIIDLPVRAAETRRIRRASHRLEKSAMSHAITHDEVVVYSMESDHLRNITEGLKRLQEGRPVDRLPSRVDIGNSLYSWLLGPEWLPVESGIRWMPGKATLRLGVPSGGKRLELEGQCPSAQLSAVPRHLMVLVDGILVSDTRIYEPEEIFHRLISLPADMVAGKNMVDIEIRVDPVDRIDGQDYGLVFGKVAIIP